jgi:hypothetical protein
VTDIELGGVADLFRVLADIDFHPGSLYRRLARSAADEPEVLGLLLPAGPRDRLPHLLFAAVQYLLLGQGSDPLASFGDRPFAVFRDWCLDHRAEIEELVATNHVQTNEVGRCAGLLPCLAAVAAASGNGGRPLAVAEVGTSAGLNLLFDRYRYRYTADGTDGDGVEAGDPASDVVIHPQVEGDGVAPDLRVPVVAWRRGLDRRPVDVTDDDAVRWLRSCIWPEQDARRALLDRAVAVARRDPPPLMAGDAVDGLGDLVAAAPPDAVVCVMHTAFISYLPDPAAFVDRLTEVAKERPLWWVSGEAAGVVPGVAGSPMRDGRIAFAYGIVPLGVPDQVPHTLARSGPHGAWLEWVTAPT